MSPNEKNLPDEDKNMFADAFGGKFSNEADALRYIRENQDLVSSDPEKRQKKIDKIINEVLFRKILLSTKNHNIRGLLIL